MPIRSLFATRLYEQDLTDPTLISGLLAEVRMLAGDDTKGRQWSATFGYQGYCSCSSHNDLHERSELFVRTADWLGKHAETFAAECGMDLGRSLQLERMWANLLEPGGVHRSHIHARSIISGTLCLEAPRGSGATCFEDPRLPMMMAAPPRADGASEDLHSFVSVEPRAGLLLMWESWLRHEVLAGSMAGPRVVLTFDFV